MIEGTASPPDTASDNDILNLYRLFLRREPDSASTTEAPLSLARLLREILLSDEFRTANLGPLRSGHLPSTTLDAPPASTLEWAAQRLPLSTPARRKLKTAISYLQAYCAILSDVALQENLTTDEDFYDPATRSALNAASRLQALADIPNSHTLTGWARSLDAPSAPYAVEIWANGRYLGRAVTGLYRHDAACRLGSKGFEGFQFELPPTLSGRTHIMIRDEKSKLILTDMVVEVASANPDDLALLRQEIDGLKAAIEDLGGRLPRSLRATTSPVDHYGDHYDNWVRQASLIQDPGRDIAMIVLLDGLGRQQSDIEDAIWSLVGQSHTDFYVTIGVLQRDLAFLQDLLARVRWRRDVAIDYVVADDGPDWRSAVTIGSHVEVVQLMDAAGTVHRDALRCMGSPFLSIEKPVAAYCDEDAFVLDDLRSWQKRAHTDPILKPDLDYDLMLQAPYLGSFLAFDRSYWLEFNQDAQDKPDALRLLERAALNLTHNEATVAHVSEVLFTASNSTIGFDAQRWSQLVQDCLGDKAAVEPHQDVLGATVPGACRIRWLAPSDTSAVVIVPTRDRIDLLQPCIDSVLASLPANATRTRVHIIDHESVEEPTLSYLSKTSLHEAVDIGRFSGPFNWALMNNLAAHETEEDVLIFLNNDTLVITPDWIDELVSLAMRDDVGVVGCRLIYDDGAIQHAGFLALDERHHFLSHDGLGDRGLSPGYLGRNALVHRTVAVTGACMAIRRDVFRRIGGFDAARFQVEANDVDLCFKASDLGLKVLYSPFATLHHLESRTRTIDTAEDVKLSGDAAERLWARWGDKVCPDPWYNPHFDRRSAHFSRLRPK